MIGKLIMNTLVALTLIWAVRSVYRGFMEPDYVRLVAGGGILCLAAWMIFVLATYPDYRTPNEKDD